MPKVLKIVFTFKFHPLHAKISTPTGTPVPDKKVKELSSIVIIFLRKKAPRPIFDGTVNVIASRKNRHDDSIAHGRPVAIIRRKEEKNTHSTIFPIFFKKDLERV